MKAKLLMIFLMLGVLMAAGTVTRAAQSQADEKAVMDTLESMAKATIAKDVATLDNIYGDEVTYSHSNSATQTKSQVLADIKGPNVAEFMKFSETTGLSPGNQIWVFGSEGTIHVDNEQRIFTGRRGDQALAELPNPREQQAVHRVEEEFVNAIRGREAVAMNTFEIGVRYMEWTEAIHMSATSGATVDLPLA